MDYEQFRPQIDQLYKLLVNSGEPEHIYQKILELANSAYQEWIRQGRESANY
jgi:hypothetical protein